MNAVEYVHGELNSAVTAATYEFFGTFLIDVVGEDLPGGNVQWLLGGAASRHRYACALAKACNDRLEELHEDGYVDTYQATGCSFRVNAYGMTSVCGPTVNLSYRLEAS